MGAMKRWMADMGLALGFGVLAWIGITFARHDGPVAVVWLPNALLLGVMLQRERRDLRPFLLCGLAGAIGAIAGGIPAALVAVRMPANLIEVAAILAAMGIGAARADLSDLRQLGRFASATLLAPVISGAIAAVPAVLMIDMPALTVAVPWAMSHALGILVATPLICALGQAWRARRHLRWSRVRDGAMVAIVSLAVAGGLFAQSRYPLLFLACPLVVLAAIRLELLGAAVAIVSLTVVATIATLNGTGPITLVDGGFEAKLLTLQLFLAANFSLGLPVAAIIRGLRQTRARLKERNDFANAILGNMHEVIFRTRGMTHWSYLNPAWEAVTGYTADESIGWHVSRLLHPDDRHVLEDWQSIYRAGEDFNGASARVRLIHRDGSTRHVEVTTTTLRNEQGVADATVGTIRDVTRQVLAETALRESEGRFQTLADFAPVGIFRTDASGGLTYANKAWCELAGLGQEAAQGIGWARAIDPRDLPVVASEWRNAVAAGGRYRGVFRFQHADGSIVWVEAMAAPEIDVAGAIVGHIGINVDVTERTFAVAALEESEAQLALLADNATDAVFRLALDGTCLYASPSVREVVGAAPQALVGRSMLDRFHEDDDARVRNTYLDLARGVANRAVVTYRSEPVDQPDSWRWLEANCGLLRDGHGAPQEIIVSIRDISRRKELELELAGARDAAEVAANAKASFLANMSHEIRTPMNGVIGATELLLADDLSSDHRAKVQVIADSGRAMMRLLNDILDLSKIDAGEMTIAAEPVDPRHALKGCAKLMTPLAAQKGLDFDVEVTAAVPDRIEGDSLRLRQIVLNLLGNAVKFTAAGGIVLRADAVTIDDAAVLEIEVRDTGIGIAPERQRAVFDQFAQADGDTARRYGGTGLGLAISAQLARLMGGSLTLDSVPGRGSSFFLRVPLVTLATPAATVSAPAAIVPPRDGETPLRVLLAEDHEINQMLAGAMLQRLGARIVVAVDGASAIAAVADAAAAGDPFDLVLMDMQMPGVDGVEATRQLRAAGIEAATLPIVALTANAYADDVDLCLSAGMQAHLAKPLRLAELQAVLDRWGRATAPDAPATLHQLSALIRRGDLGDASIVEISALLRTLSAATDRPRMAAAAAALGSALAGALPDHRAALLADGLATLARAA